MIDYHLLQLCSDPAEFNRRMIESAITQTITLEIVTIARMYCGFGDYQFVDEIRGVFPDCLAPNFNWQTINTLVFYAFVGEMQELKNERREKEVEALK